MTVFKKLTSEAGEFTVALRAASDEAAGLALGLADVLSLGTNSLANASDSLRSTGGSFDGTNSRLGGIDYASAKGGVSSGGGGRTRGASSSGTGGPLRPAYDPRRGRLRFGSGGRGTGNTIIGGGGVDSPGGNAYLGRGRGNSTTGPVITSDPDVADEIAALHQTIKKQGGGLL